MAADDCWRQVWPLPGCLAASLAAAGPLQCRYTTAGVEVVVIGVNREGGQRRGEIGGGREEIGRTTDGLEVKKMIGRVRAG